MPFKNKISVPKILRKSIGLILVQKTNVDPEIKRRSPLPLCVTPLCHVFSWNHAVHIRRGKVAVYLIILCGIENFVGIVQNVSIFCTCVYNLFFILEHIHCKNLSTTDKRLVNINIYIITDSVLASEPRPTRDIRSTAVFV